MHGTNIAQTVGGAWVAENVGADHTVINRIGELVNGIRIGDDSNERTGSGGTGTSGEVVIGEKWRIAVGVEGIGDPCREQIGLLKEEL